MEVLIAGGIAGAGIGLMIGVAWVMTKIRDAVEEWRW